ncbi:hypothetical protein vBEcoMWL3_gp178c [Escherichia phage vB_EcoM_WL-3]|nr:hypothetical protein vBEcoMWL3_gp178c [Escherichia phage vB_EcoM_WL-3]
MSVKLQSILHWLLKQTKVLYILGLAIITLKNYQFQKVRKNN